jgi:hypothetical protein
MMMSRFLFFAVSMMLLVSSSMSCTENIPDCPTQMCVMAGGWKLVEVYEEDVKSTQDISKYRITLSMPDAQATEGSFNRTGTLGQSDIGIWKIQNGNKELLLEPDTSPQEPYIIDSFSPRTLILVINRDSNKEGPSQIKYVFEPF